MSGRGPEDVLSNGPEDVGVYRVDDWTRVDGVTELDSPVEDLPTWDHRNPLPVADRLRSDQMATYGKHRRKWRRRQPSQPRRPRWWRRIDWRVVLVVSSALFAIGVIGYLTASAFAALAVDSPVLGATAAQVRVAALKADIAIVLSAFAAELGLVLLLCPGPER